MQYDWWSHEDYGANDYTMLTPDIVYKRFYDAIRSYNELERNDPSYKEPEILHKYSDNLIDKMGPDTIPNIMVPGFQTTAMENIVNGKVITKPKGSTNHVTETVHTAV